jgi:hypothetical protein
MSAAEPNGGTDPLAELRERVQQAQEAAERAASAAQAQARTAGGADPPAQGWSSGADDGRDAGSGGGAGGADAGDWRAVAQALAPLAEALRGAIPLELRQTVAELVRELLIAVRALIDWLLDRMERSPGPTVEVEDIPIR